MPFFLKKVFKYRLKPTKGQEQQFLQYLGATRFLYNCALEHRIIAYQSGGVSINYYDQANELKQIKKTEGLEWLGDVHSQVLQGTLKRVDQAFKNFFRSGFGFPKWAKRSSWNSFRFPQIYKLTITNNRVRLPNIGLVKFVQHRELIGTPKQISIVKENKHWYVCICVEFEPDPSQGESQAVGIDLGVARLATLSDGTYFENPQFFKKYQRQLRIKQRKLARQKKFGRNWYKTKHQISKLHAKIRRCRLDYLHKVSHAITSKYNIVFVEDLKLKNMTTSAKGTIESPGRMVKQKSGLNRSLLDSGLGILLNQLEYKTLHQYGHLARKNPAYTSQTCSNCGCCDSRNRISQSVFKCIDCSFAINADENAAINIESAGLADLPLTWCVGPSVGKEVII